MAAPVLILDDFNNTVAGICTVGNYCPIGTASPIPCPAGTYSNTSGNTNITDCRLCLAGSYCPSPSIVISYTCVAGYYCPEGTKDYLTNGCEAGYYCPEGVSSQIVSFLMYMLLDNLYM